MDGCGDGSIGQLTRVLPFPPIHPSIRPSTNPSSASRRARPRRSAPFWCGSGRGRRRSWGRFWTWRTGRARTGRAWGAGARRSAATRRRGSRRRARGRRCSGWSGAWRDCRGGCPRRNHTTCFSFTHSLTPSSSNITLTQQERPALRVRAEPVGRPHLGPRRAGEGGDLGHLPRASAAGPAAGSGGEAALAGDYLDDSGMLALHWDDDSTTRRLRTHMDSRARRCISP